MQSFSSSNHVYIDEAIKSILSLGRNQFIYDEVYILVNQLVMMILLEGSW